MSGEFELDESYFGEPRKKLHAQDRRKRDRGTENKVPVFGIKKRDDGTVLHTDHRKRLKSNVITHRVVKRLVASKNSIVYTDKRRGYDGLVFDGYKHFRVNHSKQYPNRKGMHINGMEKFWGYSKQQLANFIIYHEVPSTFTSKRCWIRYNKKHGMLKILKKRLSGLSL